MTGLDVERVARGDSPPFNIPPRKAKEPRLRKGERFLKGPVPWDWLSLACNLPGQTTQVAIALWFYAGLRKSRKVTLGSQITAELGVSRDAKRRALEWLEQAGLVSVKRQRRRAPVVTLLDIPATTQNSAPPTSNAKQS